jgi:cholest-4-en-3-one 26-monooxygenase
MPSSDAGAGRASAAAERIDLKPGDIDLSDPSVFLDGQPYDYYAMLRREAPVHWQPPGSHLSNGMPIKEGFFVLTKYEDVAYVSRSPRLFSSHLGSAFVGDPPEDDLAGMRAMLLNMDPPEHQKYRRLVQRGFTPRTIAELEPKICAHAKRIVDDVADKGECDFVADLAVELPLILICELMGVPEHCRRQVFDWTNRLIGADDPDMSPSAEDVKAAALEMWMYSDQLAAEKLATPDGTLICKYMNSEVDGERITPFQLNNFFLLLSVAGSETTRNATTHAMRLFCEHPEQYDLLRSDVDRYLPAAIEEVLRYSPSVIAFRRTATQDISIRGVEIRAGQKVVLYYPSANRDEEVFDEPDRFDITRPAKDHLAFGIGEHFCLGANLARMQLRCIMREILTRLPDMELAGPPRRARNALVDGIKQMPVRFTPERR